VPTEENEGSRVTTGPPKIVWLFLALCPAAAIAFGTAKHAPDSTMQIVTFLLNPAVTIFCTYFLLRREDGGVTAGRIVGSVMLGGFIAVLNMLGGMFAGCAIGGFDMR
jgi:hypothetical protein